MNDNKVEIVTKAAKVVFFCLRIDFRRVLKQKDFITVMQPKSSERGAHAGNGFSLPLQPELPTRTPVPRAAVTGNPEENEVRVPMASGTEDTSGGTSSRRCRGNSHSHSHSQMHGRSWAQQHSNLDPELDLTDSTQESGEPTSSFSELRCILRWFQKSLPFLIILCSKLVIQHALGKY